jgi:hypothetical protein
VHLRERKENEEGKVGKKVPINENQKRVKEKERNSNENEK